MKEPLGRAQQPGQEDRVADVEVGVLPRQHGRGEPVGIPDLHRAAQGLLAEVRVAAAVEVGVFHTRPLLFGPALLGDFLGALIQLGGTQVAWNVQSL